MHGHAGAGARIAMLLCVVKGWFGRGAGSPVIGHSGEGKLVSGQAVRRWVQGGTTDREQDNRMCGVRAFVGQSRPEIGAQRGSAW